MDEEEFVSAGVLEDNEKEKLSTEELQKKRKKIKSLKNKFKKLFKQLDKPTFSLVENLINELAFMSVTLEENRQHIEEYGVKEEDFLATLDEMSEKAFDDQCTAANPRYPLISEIKEMYIRAYYGGER